MAGTFKFRKGLVVADLSGGVMQFGVDPRCALRLTGLATCEVKWLRDVGARRHLSLRAAASWAGVSDARRDQILEALGAAGALVCENSRRKLPALTAPGGGVADVQALGALRFDGAGKLTLLQRARAAIALTVIDRLGALIALNLATAGVGRLILPDDAAVEPGDVGFGAYLDGAVGCSRYASLATRLRQVCPSIQVTPDGVADLTVVLGAHRVGPERVVRLMGQGAPHLAITMREADVIVGPLVIPGETPCLRCVDLWRAEQDPWWEALWTQLPSQAPSEALLVASAAALATGQVLAFIDQARPVTLRGELEVALPQAIAQFRTIESHRECGCTRLMSKAAPVA